MRVTIFCQLSDIAWLVKRHNQKLLFKRRAFEAVEENEAGVLKTDLELEVELEKLLQNPLRISQSDIRVSYKNSFETGSQS